MADTLTLSTGVKVQRLSDGRRRYLQRYGIVTDISEADIATQRQSLAELLAKIQAELDEFDELSERVAALDAIDEQTEVESE